MHFNCLPIDSLNSLLTHVMFNLRILGKQQLGGRVKPSLTQPRSARSQSTGKEMLTEPVLGGLGTGGWLERRGGPLGQPPGFSPQPDPQTLQQNHVD